ncbi:MAG TPA: GNAT family protein [Aggregatilineales bacterium]|nr:GNAT family protein [Aggregatilineales bacterium]
MKRRDGSSDHVETPFTPMVVQPVTLEGRFVRLEPLTLDYVDALCEVGLDETLWRYIPVHVETPEQMRKYVETALKGQAEGTMLPFATCSKEAGRVVGSTRYMNIDKGNYHVEIGSTWIGQAWQRTAVNTEAKYLMLGHAFEVLGCLRVELKTDALNERSRNAILRIGARQEGIFRNHVIMSTGRVRDSVYFSITDTEWPAVKASLEERLNHT